MRTPNFRRTLRLAQDFIARQLMWLAYVFGGLPLARDLTRSDLYYTEVVKLNRVVTKMSKRLKLARGFKETAFIQQGSIRMLTDAIKVDKTEIDRLKEIEGRYGAVFERQQAVLAELADLKTAYKQTETIRDAFKAEAAHLSTALASYKDANRAISTELADSKAFYKNLEQRLRFQEDRNQLLITENAALKSQGALAYTAGFDGAVAAQQPTQQQPAGANTPYVANLEDQIKNLQRALTELNAKLNAESRVCSNQIEIVKTLREKIKTLHAIMLGEFGKVEIGGIVRVRFEDLTKEVSGTVTSIVPEAQEIHIRGGYVVSPRDTLVAYFPPNLTSPTLSTPPETSCVSNADKMHQFLLTGFNAVVAKWDVAVQKLVDERMRAGTSLAFTGYKAGHTCGLLHEPADQGFLAFTNSLSEPDKAEVNKAMKDPVICHTHAAFMAGYDDGLAMRKANDKTIAAGKKAAAAQAEIPEVESMYAPRPELQPLITGICGMDESLDGEAYPAIVVPDADGYTPPADLSSDSVPTAAGVSSGSALVANNPIYDLAERQGYEDAVEFDPRPGSLFNATMQESCFMSFVSGLTYAERASVDMPLGKGGPLHQAFCRGWAKGANESALKQVKTASLSDDNQSGHAKQQAEDEMVVEAVAEFVGASDEDLVALGLVIGRTESEMFELNAQFPERMKRLCLKMVEHNKEEADASGFSAEVAAALKAANFAEPTPAQKKIAEIRLVRRAKAIANAVDVPGAVLNLVETRREVQTPKELIAGFMLDKGGEKIALPEISMA